MSKSRAMELHWNQVADHLLLPHTKQFPNLEEVITKTKFYELNHFMKNYEKYILQKLKIWRLSNANMLNPYCFYKDHDE